MQYEIVDGHMVDGQTLAMARFLYSRAESRRAAALLAEGQAKAILRARGIVAKVVITDKMTRLLRAARRDVDEADRMIGACPTQVKTDETWTG